VIARRAGGSVQIVPPTLVVVARTALQNQGLDPYIITSAGELDPMKLFGSGFTDVEIRTTLFNTHFRPNEPSNPATTKLLKQLQPTIILTGPAGRVTLAPYGVAKQADLSGSGLAIGLGVGAGLLGLMLIGSKFFR
jgi:hypothetical protein